MEKLYYLVSDSGDSSNTRTHFKCYLPQKIENHGNLSIKLLNLSFENSFLTYHHLSNQPALVVTYPPDIKLPWSFTPPNTDYVKQVITFASPQTELQGYVTTFIYLKDNRCRSLKDSVTIINSCLTSCKLDRYARFITSHNTDNERTIVKLFNRVSNLAISTNVANVLGFDTGDIWNMTEINNFVNSSQHLPHGLQTTALNSMYMFNNEGRDESYSATFAYNNTLLIPKTVDVQILETEKIITSSGFCNTVSILPGPGRNDCSISSYSPLAPISRHINEPSLSSLTFSLSDTSTDETVLFSQGTASYATVSISEKAKMSTNQQLITIFSNDKHSKKLSPKNSNTHFTTHLPKHVDIGPYSSWSLKLLSFSCSAEICNLNREQTYFDVYEMSKKSDDLHLFRCSFQPGKYSTVQQLIDEVNRSLSYIEENVHKMYFSYADTGYISIHNSGNKTCILKLNPDLSNVFGSTFDNPEIVVKKSSYLTLPRIADVDIARPRYIKILCRETEHTFFAGERAQVFSFFAIDAAQKSSKISNFYEFLDPPRVNIAAHFLSELTFTLTTGFSPMPIALENNYNTPTHLVLALERHNPL